MKCLPLAALAAAALVSAARPGKASEAMNPRDGLLYAWVHPGVYVTGCSPADTECIGRERPRRKVVIEPGFWIGTTEVTQAAFQRVMRANPSRYRGPKRPVEQVDWESASAYCNKVGMRLPTESEWEFAALGGIDGPRYGPLDSIAWYDGNSGGATHEVGRKLANAYGLFDMLGNVWEWVEDTPQADLGRRIMKGGSFYNLSRNVRVPERETPLSNLRHRNVGFRCAAYSLPAGRD